MSHTKRSAYGRPLTEEENLRSKSVQVNLTVSEYETISQLAGNETLSTYARQLIFAAIRMAHQEAIRRAHQEAMK